LIYKFFGRAEPKAMSNPEMNPEKKSDLKQVQPPNLNLIPEKPTDRRDDELGNDEPSNKSSNEVTIHYNHKDMTPKVASSGTFSLKGAEPVRSAIPGLVEKQRIGDYEILQEIARGGMGIVYKAQQKKLDRIVAIKTILTGELATPETISRFYSEARAAATLDHPGIVPIYEISQHKDQHYFSMGYVEGTSLAARVAKGPLPPIEAVGIVAKIAEAIEYAHAKGVIHRDIKPANVLLDLNGDPKVTDFGLARIKNQNSNLTQTGAILGTPSYMSPEQASGDSNKSGPLSDVYSMGGLLYCLLTGRPPFQAASPIDTVMQVLQREPISPTVINPTIPKDLETICLKCLQKKPANRYTTAGELEKDLRRWLKGEPIHARAITPWERTWRWTKRNPIVTGLLCSTAIGMLLALAFARHAGQMRVNAERSMSEAMSASAQAHMTLTSIESRSGNTTRALSNLAKVDSGLRKTDWHLFSKCLNGGDLELCFHTKDVEHLAISPDGTLLASSSSKEIWITSMETSERKHVITPPGLDTPSVLSFTPDQRFLIVGYKRNAFDFSILIYPLQGESTPKVKNLSYDPRSIRFSNDGSRMIVTGYQSSQFATRNYGFEERETETAELIERHDGFSEDTIDAWYVDARNSILVTTARSSRTLTDGIWSEHAPYSIKAVNHDGSAIARVAYSNNAERREKYTVEVVNRTADSKISNIAIPATTKRIVFAPDGQSLITWESNRRIARWDIKTGSPERNTFSEPSELTAIALCPEGRRIITGHWNGIVKVWLTDELDSRVRRWSRLPAKIVGFSKNEDQVLGVTTSELRSWDCQSPFDASYSKGTLIIPNLEAKDRHLQFATSANGTKAVSYRSSDRWKATEPAIDLWDLETGKQISTVYQAKDVFPIFAISSEGKTIAYVTGESGSEIVVFDCEGKSEINRIDLKKHFDPNQKGFLCPINVLQFLDEKTLVFDINKCLFRYSFEKTEGSTSQILGSKSKTCIEKICIDESRKQIAICYTDNQVRVIGLNTSMKTFDMQLDKDDASIDAISWSSDGRMLILARENGTVECWDIYSKELLFIWEIGQRREHIQMAVGKRTGRIFISNGYGIFCLNPERSVSQAVADLSINHSLTLEVGMRRHPPRDKSNVYFLSPIELGKSHAALIRNLLMDPFWHEARLGRESINTAITNIFHLTWMLRASPNDSWLHDDLQLAYNRLSDEQKSIAVSDFIIRRTLELPRGNSYPSVDLFKSMFFNRFVNIIQKESSSRDELLVVSRRLKDIATETADPDVMLLLAQTHLRLSEPLLAIDAIEVLMQKNPSIKEKKGPGFFIARTLLAIAFSRVANHDNALKCFREAEAIASIIEKPTLFYQRIFFDAKRELFGINGLFETVSVDVFNKEGTMERISTTPWGDEDSEYSLNRYTFNNKIKHNGSYSLELGSKIRSANSLVKRVEVVPNRRYHFSGWFLAKPYDGFWIDYESQKSKGLQIAISGSDDRFESLENLNGWKSVEFDFVAKSDQMSIFLELHADPDVVVFIDDLAISLIEVDHGGK
jgi:serine/threonine protein kinase